MSSINVQIWSDIACPWCSIGKRRFGAALEQFEQRERVQVTWRSFELDPEAPPERAPEAYVARLARKYSTSTAEAQAMVDRMTQTAADEGLEFRFDRIRPGNTFDAHRLLHAAKAGGLQGALKERFLRGYMTEGEPIGDPQALARMAVEVGMDAGQVSETLDGDAFAEAVRSDERDATELGIRGVPFFVLGREVGLSGAQPAGTILSALRQLAE